MKAEFMDSFLQATQDVFKQMLNLDIERVNVELKKDLLEGKEVNVLIGVVGSLVGVVAYNFTKPMALAMVKSMSGMEINQLNIFVTSALGEIGNIISGNALGHLANANYICDIAPPQIILSETKSISLSTTMCHLVSLKTNLGDFTITIALKENH